MNKKKQEYIKQLMDHQGSFRFTMTDHEEDEEQEILNQSYSKMIK